MKIKAGSYLLIVIIAVTLFMGVLSLMLPSVKVALVPAFASWFVFVLAAIQLRRELVAGREDRGVIQQEAGQLQVAGKSELLKYILAFAWMTGLLLAIYLVGYLIAVPLFIFFYLKLHGHGWLKSVVLTASAIILMYVIFVVVLKVILFPGVVFGGYI